MRFVAALFFASLCISVPSWAQSPLTWTALGPWGGTYPVLTSDSSGGLYAAGEGISRRSSDGGASWTAFADLNISQLEVGPGGELFALSGAGWRLLRSVDGGANWYDLEVNTGTAPSTLQGVAIAPDGTIYAGNWFSGSAPGEPGQSNLFRSTDRGLSWTTISLAEKQYPVPLGFNRSGHVFAERGVPPVDTNDVPRTLVLRSTDRGVSWDSVAEIGTDAGPMIADGDTLLLPAAHLFVSTDGGSTWQRRGRIGARIPWYPGVHQALAMDADGCLLSFSTYAVLRSTDRGLTWQTVGDSGVVPVSVAAGRGGFVVGLRDSGIVRSTDHGLTFAKITNGLPGMRVSRVRVLNDTLIAVQVPSGYVARTVGSNEWRQGDNVHFSLRDKAGTFIRTSRGRISRSTDLGATWIEADSTLPTATGTLFPGPPGVFAYQVFNALYYSRDDGRSWMRLDTGFLEPIGAVSFDTSGAVLVASLNTGLWRFEESVGRFRPLRASIALIQVTGMYQDHGVLWIGTEKGLRRSTDNGLNWSVVGPPSMHVRDIAFDGQGTVILAADSGVFISRDRGDSWLDASSEDMRIPYVLAVDGDGHVYVGAAFGLFVSNESAAGVDDPRRTPDETALAVSIAPLPAAREMDVAITVDRPGRLRLDLVDLFGREILSLDPISVDAGLHHIDLPMSGVSVGAYYLRIQIGGRSATTPVVIAR